MKYIKNFDKHRSEQMINEEFIGKLVKGALSKLFQVFSAPFKDLVNDIKNAFKEDDPNSIKGILMTNLDQAIDAAQKQLSDKNLQEGDLTNVMTGFITSLTDLANGIGKDFATAIGDKSKASGAYEVAKALLIGSKEAGWKGIVGVLNDANYKYSKPKYEATLLAAAGKKTGTEALKLKQKAAFTFFDNFQKDIKAQIDKELTEEELEKIYKDAVKKGGGQVGEYNYAKLKELYDKKTPVMYKREGYDDSKKPEEQRDKVGTKVMTALDDQGKVTFETEDGEKFTKKYSDILGVPNQQKDETAEQITKNLTDMKTDKEKITSVKNYTDFLKTATPDKIAEVEKIIKPQEGAK